VLEEVQINNYRCLRSLTVPLRPLTVLIGPNDTGKSAFLGAIDNLIQGPERFSQSDHWRHDTEAAIRLIGKLEQGTIECHSAAKGKKDRRFAPSSDVRGHLFPVRRFFLPAIGVPMKCQGYAAGEEAELDIGQDGGRVAALCDFLLRRDRTRFFKMVETLQRYIPGLEDIAIGTPDAATRQIDLVIDDGFHLSADHASAGVRLLLFFVALAHHPRPPRTILVEEPENGIHPRRLSDVMHLLRATSKGEFGDYPAQVIVTTHSPYLLDSVDLSQDQVLVFRRNDHGSRTASPVDAERMKTFIDDFMLGEIWFNEEEAGLVAKP